MRTIVDLPKQDLELLARVCESEKISRAEAIRQAVVAYLRDKREPDSSEAFGLWRSRGVEGRRYEDGIRAEWEVHESRGRHKRPR